MKDVVDLKDYICSVPFNSLEIHNNVCFVCCPSWLPNKVELNQIPLKDVYNSEPIVDIRNSILDGSFRYCDKEMCPYLSKLLNHKIASGPISLKSNSNIKSAVVINNTPDYLVMNFDRTCNYKCPSCRVDMIVANSSSIKRINTTIEEMEETFSDSIETIYCSGTADPFASVSYRNYLRNFNPKKYPKLNSIHLHTNASLWNKEMWDSMPNIHKYVKSCEISIDAGTRKTYEMVTRLGGNWDVLISNLKFIATIKSMRKVKTSFVVQKSNYREMEPFLKKMKEIFGMKTKVFYGKINNWGTFTPEQFEKLKIWDPKHPEHNYFLRELKKVANDPFVFHNLHEFLPVEKTLI